MASAQHAGPESSWRESWAWDHLDPEIRDPLAQRVQYELGKRSLVGAIVYFIVTLVLAWATPYDRDHPVLLSAAAVVTLLLGLLRLLFGRRLMRALAGDPSA